MTVHLANATARVACDAINALIDAGGGAGKLQIYSGTRPATADDAPSGTLLVEFAFAATAFGASAQVGNGATATANAIASVTAAATGTATWFRVLAFDDDVIFDGSVTATGGGGDLQLSTVSIAAGIDVSVVSLTATMPEGV